MKPKTTREVSGDYFRQTCKTMALLHGQPLNEIKGTFTHNKEGFSKLTVWRLRDGTWIGECLMETFFSESLTVKDTDQKITYSLQAIST